MPSAMELANLAATLARTAGEAPDKLVDAAWALWRQAAWKIQVESDAREAAKARREHILRAETPPVSLDKFLARMMPQKKGRPADKAKAFRDYLHTVPMKPGESVESLFAKAQANGFEQSEFQYHARRFRDWYQKQISGKRRKAAKGS